MRFSFATFGAKEPRSSFSSRMPSPVTALVKMYGVVPLSAAFSAAVSSGDTAFPAVKDIASPARFSRTSSLTRSAFVNATANGIFCEAISVRISLSNSVRPIAASTARTAMSVCARIRFVRSTRSLPSSPSSSRPGVSMITTGPRGSSSIALRTGSVVVPRISDTMLTSCPVTALTREDFPALRSPNHAMWTRSAETVSCKLMFSPIAPCELRQNRKSLRFEFLMSSIFCAAMPRTFSFGIFASSSSIMRKPISAVSGEA